jgi:hypothetical protein
VSGNGKPQEVNAKGGKNSVCSGFEMKLSPIYHNRIVTHNKGPKTIFDLRFIQPKSLGINQSEAPKVIEIIHTHLGSKF